MRTTVLLDTNVLLLYIAGLTDRRCVDSLRRLRDFTLADFDRLDLFVSRSSLILTPNTVTETSNLLPDSTQSPFSAAILTSLRVLLERFGERYVPSVQALDHVDSPTLGVADAVLLTILVETGATLITTDQALWATARAARLTAVNFNHVRVARR